GPSCIYTLSLHDALPICDNQILLNALARLEGNGNTLVVVEHDEDTIRRASHIIDIGPGAGVRGGMVVAQGTAQEIMNNAASVTRSEEHTSELQSRENLVC